ncbi:hypothetical protein K466DRAFT_528335 [Polyporus arcularius HHB13444]|uniref:Uncharacterized protein n=1 Tax=Polyporus arcularius HHB13444 TaxID=1314778 RepID=A0A5C3P4J5_9APHY|nr:hypothetical protein K466DRAFT_528335 [Polyporus arcularius HHB13444]
MTEPSSSLVEESLNERIARQRAAVLSFPYELCPASRPSSPTSEERILDLKTRIATAVNTAGGDPTNPKWGFVSRMVQLGCTSRKYIGVVPGVRTGDGRKVTLKNFKWELPETEEGWAAYEQRWEAAVAEEKRTSETKVAAKSSRTSKYFKAAATEEPVAVPRLRASSSKAEVIREKVERWQAQVATVPPAAPDAPMSQDPTSSPPAPKVDKGKVKERAPQGEKLQASLGFPVVKRPSVTSAKGGSGGPSKPRISPAARVPTPPDDNPSPDVPEDPIPHESTERPPVPEPPPVAKITDLPEMSFLPPSFPSQLQTSTPPLNDRRQKPPPIAPCSPPPSSPSRLSVQSFDPSRPQRHALPQQSSSLPAVSPVRRPAKRVRTPNSSPKDILMGTPQSRSPRLKSPLSKKARVDAPAVPEQPASSGPVLVPPSTPPPSSPPARPVTPVSRGKGLGNAKGLPVPSTPDPHPLPTLTELLASSRRSRMRPRPPSRKSTPHRRASSRASDRVSEHELELPALAEDADEDERSAREHTPEPSPSKTYFSSPASGSSDSPGSVAQRALSPVSPLFTQHPSAFMPKFVSTQQPSGHDDPFAGGFAQTQGSMMRGSSGFFAMGYSSQFDVEGHVEQVSELLERDVDFNGWIRDLGEEGEGEGEDHDADMPAATSQSQENGAIGVGGY